MAYSVNTLPDYVEQHKSELKGKAILKAKSATILGLQTGVKGQTALNNMDVNVVFQNGASCGFNASGDTTISQRVIDGKPVKVNMEWCPKDLLNKYLQTEVVISAKGQELPAEEVMMDEIAKGIAAKIEQTIWQGNASDGNAWTGFINLNKTGIVTSTASAADAYGAIKTAYELIPATILYGRETAIFVGTDVYRKFIMQLMEKNLYHHPSNEGSDMEIYFPATNTKVIALNGLNGTNKIYAGEPANFVYGCSDLDDSMEFDLFFDQSSRTFKFICEFVGGTQIRFTDEAVEVTLE